MSRPDIVIRITYNMLDPHKAIIKTNAKPEAVEEIIGAWLSSQIGQGEDLSDLNHQDEYTITIGLVLENDTFSTTSDAGNMALTCGIVRDVFSMLDKIQVIPFS